MFVTSPEVSDLNDALAKAQGEIESAIKDKKNPAFRSNYASFDSVLDACRPALVKNNISVTQWPIHTDDGRVHLITRVSCKNQWMQTQFSIPVDKLNAHGYGSALTYLKRFCYSAAIGVSTDLDDDGNAASAMPVTTQRATAPASKPSLGFDPLNTAHLTGIKAELTKRSIDKDQQVHVINAMIGKPLSELDNTIKTLKGN